MRSFVARLAALYHATKTPVSRRRAAVVLAQLKAGLVTQAKAVERLTVIVLDAVILAESSSDAFALPREPQATRAVASGVPGDYWGNCLHS